MLTIDLGLLAQRHRIRIEETVPAGSDLWQSMPWRFGGPVDLSLDVQQAVSDVVVRGRVSGPVELSCRRCLRPVRYDLDEELTFLYRSGVAGVEAESEEVYALPERGQLDLGPAVREHVLLAVPQYMICREECRGFCARCGTDLNETSCDCSVDEEDPRWAALRRLRSE